MTRYPEAKMFPTITSLSAGMELGAIVLRAASAILRIVVPQTQKRPMSRTDKRRPWRMPCRDTRSAARRGDDGAHLIVAHFAQIPLAVGDRCSPGAGGLRHTLSIIEQRSRNLCTNRRSASACPPTTLSPTVAATALVDTPLPSIASAPSAVAPVSTP
jgi:hypothetical protein